MAAFGDKPVHLTPFPAGFAYRLRALMLTARAPVERPRGEHGSLDKRAAAFAGLALAVENLKAKQRPVVPIFIHLAAGSVGQPRDRQQRLRQGIELAVRQRRGLVPPGQPSLPENLNAQLVAQPGEECLVQQQAGKLTLTEFCRQQAGLDLFHRQAHIQHVGADPE